VKRLSLLIASALALALVATFAITGVSLIPTSLALGPCLKDWTSPVSYRWRASRLDGIRFHLADAELQLCYGRPVARGRAIFGGLVPWDTLWRLGANEPTRLSVSKPVTLAGISLPAGRYSLYVIPRPGEWTLFVSRSTLHWGNDISAAVRSKEIGQATIPVEILPQAVDTFTARIEDHGSSSRVALAFEWERTRVMLELARTTVPSNLGVLP